MIEISPPQLNDFLHAKTSSFPIYYQEVAFGCKLMLWTGCRANEAIDLTRWTIQPNNTVILKTLKNNNPRSFLLDELPPDFTYWKSEINRYKNYVSYRRIQYVFNNMIASFGITNGQKPALLHLYRYNYIKWLYYNGMTPEHIQTMVGHTALASTMFYINAPIIATNNLGG